MTLNLLAYFAVFASSLVFIILKVFQQSNITHKQYKWMLPTSFLMATTEVFVIASTAKNGIHIGLIIAIGLGSGIGSIIGTYFYNYLLRRKSDEKLVDNIDTNQHK